MDDTLDRFELEQHLNERAAEAVKDYLTDPSQAHAELEARLEDRARDIAAAYDGVYVRHYIDFENGVLQVEAVQRIPVPPPGEIEVTITPWNEADDVEDHPVACANCGETASGFVKLGTDYIHRVVCSTCGYKEDR